MLEDAQHQPVFEKDVQGTGRGKYTHYKTIEGYTNIVDGYHQEHHHFVLLFVHTEGIAIGYIPFRHIYIAIA